MRWGRNARIKDARIEGSIHKTETREDGYYCACGVKLAELGEIDPLGFAFLDHLAIVHGGDPKERKAGKVVRHNGPIVLPKRLGGGAWTLDELEQLAREQGVLIEDETGPDADPKERRAV